MVDQLAKDYANQPVVFIEQNVDSPLGRRKDRYWAVQSNKNAYLPYIMLDSGHQYWSDYAGDPQTQYNNYKRLVDAELTRPPKAEVTAKMERAGSHMHFTITVKNLSGDTLRPANSATVHAIVYEDTDYGLTSRYVRAAVALSISTPLADGASATYQLDTPDLVGVNWAKLHGLAMVDYRPGGSGPYDMLQANLATNVSFAVTPAKLVFMIDPAKPADTARSLSVSSPAGVSWTASADRAWLALEPASGTAGRNVVVRVSVGALANGKQTGTILFKTSSGSYNSQSIPVTVFYQQIENLYLPNVRK